MVRWASLCAVALAFLAAPSVVDTLVQPTLETFPFLARHAPGGVIALDLSVERTAPLDASLPDTCFYVFIEETGPREVSRFYEDESSAHVCPRMSADANLVAPKAKGTLVIENNGTQERIPFLVPMNGHANLWAAIGDDGMEVGSPRVLKDWRLADDAWMWVGALQALAVLVFVAGLAAGVRMGWLAGALAVATLLWIPLADEQWPHAAGWVIAFAWAVLCAEAYWRLPDRRRPVAGAPHEVHGERLDQPPQP